MQALDLARADRLASAALEKRRDRGFNPIAVVVLDAAGDIVVVKREDGCSLLRVTIATAKAWGCLGMGCGGRALERRSKANPAFFSALTHLADGRMVPAAGGVLVRDKSARILGAVGVSGDTAPNDEECAIAGIRTAGLQPDCGEEN